MPTDKAHLLRKVLRESKVLQLPQRSIATFGPTHLPYYCLSALNPHSTRIRQGLVTAEKPKIILRDELRELFHGFDKETREISQELIDEHEKDLKALGYAFKHQGKRSRLVHKPIKETYADLFKQTQDEKLSAILRGPDAYWEVSLFKFTVEMALKSIKSNVTELDERGFFNPESRLRSRIERLFYSASQSRDQLPTLASCLKDNGLFEEYEDRFFDLVKNK